MWLLKKQPNTQTPIWLERMIFYVGSGSSGGQLPFPSTLSWHQPQNLPGLKCTSPGATSLPTPICHCPKDRPPGAWRRNWSLCAHHPQCASPHTTSQVPRGKGTSFPFTRPDCLFIYKILPFHRVVGTIGWDHVFRASGIKASSVTSLLRSQQTPGVCRDCITALTSKHRRQQQCYEEPRNNKKQHSLWIWESISSVSDF